MYSARYCYISRFKFCEQATGNITTTIPLTDPLDGDLSFARNAYMFINMSYNNEITFFDTNKMPSSPCSRCSKYLYIDLLIERSGVLQSFYCTSHAFANSNENIKPVPKPMLTNHQWGFTASTGGQFHITCSRYRSIRDMSWKITNFITMTS